VSASLELVADGIWTIHHRDFAMGGMKLGTRSNVVRLPDGTVALHAPGPLTATQHDEIAALGAVSVILVPNLLHNGFCAAAARRHPEARVIAAPGTADRVKDMTIHETFGERVPTALAGVAEMMRLEGCPKMSEAVFFLPGSRTLLGVDFAFNLHGLRGFDRFAMWLNNANDKFCVTNLGRSMYVSDRAAAGRSVDGWWTRGRSSGSWSATVSWSRAGGGTSCATRGLSRWRTAPPRNSLSR
jgi:hypothetical protein